MELSHDNATDEEISMVEELVEEMFVGDNYAINITAWDDGDVHIEAHSTIGTNCNEGYPMYVVYHRQIIEYERYDNELLYWNIVRAANPKPSKVLNRIEL